MLFHKKKEIQLTLRSLNASIMGYTLWFICRPDLWHIEQTGSRSATQRRDSFSPCASHALCGIPLLSLKQRGQSLEPCCIQNCSKQELQKLRLQPMQQRTTGARKISPHMVQEDSSTTWHWMSTSISEIQCSTDGSLPGSKTYVLRVCTICIIGVQQSVVLQQWRKGRDAVTLVAP